MCFAAFANGKKHVKYIDNYKLLTKFRQIELRPSLIDVSGAFSMLCPETCWGDELFACSHVLLLPLVVQCHYSHSPSPIGFRWI